jgi:hypothetical protein
LQLFISECAIWNRYFCSQNNTNLRLHYVNHEILCAIKGQINIPRKTINGHNLRFLSSRIVHIWKTKFFIISVLKFKRYVFENCHFHIKLVIPRSQIISYQFFVSVQRSHPSMVHVTWVHIAVEWWHLCEMSLVCMGIKWNHHSVVQTKWSWTNTVIGLIECGPAPVHHQAHVSACFIISLNLRRIQRIAGILHT